MSDGTYGGITRSAAGNLNGYYASEGAPITIETLQQGFESLRRIDEANAQWEREFWDAMRPHRDLVSSDPECYMALYRLYQSSRSPVSPNLYRQLMEIVKARGIEV